MNFTFLLFLVFFNHYCSFHNFSDVIFFVWKDKKDTELIKLETYCEVTAAASLQGNTILAGLSAVFAVCVFEIFPNVLASVDMNEIF